MTPTIEALCTVLDLEHAEAVVEHRRITIRKPLTSFAAKLLAKRLAEWGDANAAAEIMIERAWQGFDKSWVRDRRPVRTVGDSALQELIEGQSNGEFERMLHAGKPVRHPQEPDTAQILTLPFVRHG